MDLIDLIDLKQNPTLKVLAVCDVEAKQKIEELLIEVQNKVIRSPDNIKDLSKGSIEAIIVHLQNDKITSDLLQHLEKLAVQKSPLILYNTQDETDGLTFLLTTTGYINIDVKTVNSQTSITASKPGYVIGSSAKLNLQKAPAASAVWKFDDDLNDDEEETIDPEDLLDEDDFKKPEANSLRVCGTTGKRKACKDCSCGLAEELEVEAKAGQVVDTSNAPKSSCGSCYLGDAFRCASCPYLGMPAFKPGEKIVISDNLLRADI